MITEDWELLRLTVIHGDENMEAMEMQIKRGFYSGVIAGIRAMEEDGMTGNKLHEQAVEQFMETIINQRND